MPDQGEINSLIDEQMPTGTSEEPAFDLDEISITGDLRNETMEKLRSVADEFGDSKDDFLSGVEAFEAHIQSFSPRQSQETKKGYEEVAEQHGEQVRDLVYNAWRAGFMEDMTRLSQMVDELRTAEKGSEGRADTLKLAAVFMVSTTRGENSRTPEQYVEEEFPRVAERLGREKVRELHTAVTNVVAPPKRPFKQFAEGIIEQGDSREVIESKLSAHRAERARNSRGFWEVFDEVVPGKEDVHYNWEHPDIVPERGVEYDNPFENWQEQVEADGGKILDATVGEKIIQKGFFGKEYRFNPHVNQYNRVTKEHVLHINENGDQRVREVDVTRVTFKSHKYSTADRAGNEVPYGTATIHKPEIVSDVLFDGRFDNIVKITEMLEQISIPPAKRVDGKVEIPVVVSRDDRKQANWLRIGDFDHQLLETNLNRSRESFERAGFYYATEKARQEGTERESALSSLTGDERSWIDVQRAGNGLDEALAVFMEGMSDDEKAKLEVVRQAVSDSFTSVSVEFGHYSIYEAIAADRLQGRGLSPDHPQWNLELAREAALVAEEYMTRVSVYKSVASEVCDKVKEYSEADDNAKLILRGILKHNFEKLGEKLDLDIELPVEGDSGLSDEEKRRQLQKREKLNDSLHRVRENIGSFLLAANLFSDERADEYLGAVEGFEQGFTDVYNAYSEGPAPDQRIEIIADAYVDTADGISAQIEEFYDAPPGSPQRITLTNIVTNNILRTDQILEARINDMFEEAGLEVEEPEPGQSDESGQGEN